MIRDGGIVTGWLSALSKIDSFCEPDKREIDKPKAVPYAGGVKED